MADFDYEKYGLVRPERPTDVKATSTGDDYYDNLSDGQRRMFDKMPDDLKD